MNNHKNYFFIYCFSMALSASVHAQQCPQQAIAEINLQANRIKNNAHFLDAVFRKDRAQARKWLMAGANVDARDASDQTALEIAVQAGDKVMTDFLIDQGAALTPRAIELTQQRAIKEYHEEQKKIRQTFKELAVKK